MRDGYFLLTGKTAKHMLGDMAKINVSRLRASFGETQTEFAVRIGVNQATISRWENGEDEPSGPASILLERLDRERIARIKKTEMRAAG